MSISIKTATTSKKNIQKRGREYEQSINEKYLDSLNHSYLNYFKQQSEFPVVIIDTNKIDFVENKEDYQKICKIIFENTYNSGITRVLL